MPSYFDLLKYARTGLASPDMTAFDKLKALALCGGGLSPYTIIGQPPLSFKSDGTPLISWSMLGNGVQNGTPTPDAPIMPTFCGVRTGNLLDIEAYLEKHGRTYTKNGNAYTFGTVVTMFREPFYFSDTDVKASISGVLSVVSVAAISPRIDLMKADGTVAESRALTTSKFKAENVECAGFRLDWSSGGGNIIVDSLMLNLGSTALPYEPYGYKIPITCSGQTMPVYLGEVPTVRMIKKLVLTGEEGWNVSSGTFYITSISPDYMRERAGITYVCSHYTAQVQGNSAGDVGDGKFAMSYGASQRLYVRDESLESSNAFKQFLRDQYAAGTPVVVWYVLAETETAIVNEPLCKIGDYADELNSTDAGVSIPTAKGQNVLTVDTDLQPSEMTIKYR